MSNSRELKGMPDLTEKRWNAKSLAETAEQNRKQQEEDFGVAVIGNNNNNKKLLFLDPNNQPLHPDLVKSLQQNLKKFLKLQQRQRQNDENNNNSTTSLTHIKELYDNLFSGPRWFTKPQLLSKGYKLKPNPTPIFAPNCGKYLHLINLELFPESTRRDFIEPELIQRFLSPEKRHSNKPYWLIFSETSSSKRNYRQDPAWQTINTKVLIEDMILAQTALKSDSCLWIEKEVAEKLNLDWKKEAIGRKNSSLSKATKKQLGLDLFDEETSCFLFEPRQTDAFFNEKQIIIPF